MQMEMFKFKMMKDGMDEEWSDQKKIINKLKYVLSSKIFVVTRFSNVHSKL